MTEQRKEERRQYTREWQKANKERCLELARAWRIRNPERVKQWAKARYEATKDYVHSRDVKRKYGVTEKQYQEQLEAQNRVCGICKTSSKTRLSVDHNHTTGQFRGLLCSGCNVGLGNFKESVFNMEQAVAYLQKWTS